MHPKHYRVTYTKKFTRLVLSCADAHEARSRFEREKPTETVILAVEPADEPTQVVSAA